MGWSRDVDKLAFVVLSLALVACKKDPAEAERRAEAADTAACADKDMTACERRDARWLGQCEARHDGWPCVRAGDSIRERKTYKDAMPHYERACDYGSTLGCSRIGAIHLVEGDRAKAQTYFEKGCLMKDPFACDLRGHCFLVEVPNEACPRDPAKAKSYFLRACELRGQTRSECDAANDVDRPKPK